MPVRSPRAETAKPRVIPRDDGLGVMTNGLTENSMVAPPPHATPIRGPSDFKQEKDTSFPSTLQMDRVFWARRPFVVP
jgi:hypothetical protein